MHAGRQADRAGWHGQAGKIPDCADCMIFCFTANRTLAPVFLLFCNLSRMKEILMILQVSERLGYPIGRSDCLPACQPASLPNDLICSLSGCLTFSPPATEPPCPPSVQCFMHRDDAWMHEARTQPTWVKTRRQTGAIHLSANHHLDSSLARLHKSMASVSKMHRNSIH